MIRIGTYAFRRCECPGCVTDIYAPINVPEPRCKAHGGPGYLEQVECDEWGSPQTATPDVPSHGSGSPLPLLEA